MKPIKFKHCNLILTAPKEQPDVKDLPCCRGEIEDGTKVVISCWRMSNFGEWIRILFTRRIYLIIQGVTYPPLCIKSKNPIKENKRREG